MKQLKYKENLRKKFISWLGMNNKIKIPNKGNRDNKISKFIVLKKNIFV